MTEIESDLEQLTASFAAGRPIDPELKRRIRQCSERLREQRFEKHGFLNAAVGLIHEVREE